MWVSVSAETARPSNDIRLRHRTIGGPGVRLRKGQVRMTIDGPEVDRHAAALVRLMRSDAPLGQAHDIIAGISGSDRPLVVRAFVKAAWEDAGLPVPDRGARLHDWLVGLRGDP